MARKQQKSRRWLALPIGLGLVAATLYALLSGPMSASQSSAPTTPLSPRTVATSGNPDGPAPSRGPQISDQISDESRAQLRDFLRAYDDSEAD